MQSDTREIPLTQGYVAIVSVEDYDLLSSHKWHAFVRNHTVYAAGHNCYMHRVIMNNPQHDVDHINGNGLDNTRGNLRVCTRSQNIMNAKKRDGKTSKFKGVSWVTNGSKWQAQIMVNRKQKYIGYFQDEEAAAVAYDIEARALHGDFARLNFPISDQEPPQ